jgi:hypothetical protein
MTATTTTTAVATPALLRGVMKLDGIATLPTGVLLTALAGVLDGPFGIPAGLLVGVGLFFVAWGAGVLFLGFRPVVDRRAAVAVGVVNLLCALDGVLVVATGIGDLTTLGSLLLVALSVVVLALGAAQVVAARRQVTRA